VDAMKYLIELGAKYDRKDNVRLTELVWQMEIIFSSSSSSSYTYLYILSLFFFSVFFYPSVDPLTFSIRMEKRHLIGLLREVMWMQ
jgi:hypothetical protein